ncbi:hypothetical protein Pla22_35130 [Rubripirellula amarantea]|uniref:YdhG-like domain-containing protein n=1 Tax=Rubripirellula amarantea TaxID=2527999 RepID=A0A5C5WJE6_9BACT|nr:DUF1801 domain-containing protein [Rubripirellula amarantea]TWT50770.1 hypothetical protein Pla22_35130 [Rubripirellula amarantea]
MKTNVHSVSEYLQLLPDERQAVVAKLRKVVRENLPRGFTECINYGMIGYVVPHSRYPSGYHCDPSLPLPFVNLASQKNYVAVYHMGMYADVDLLDWFVAEYPRHCSRKLDMGKSCIRFKKIDEIPYELVGKLAAKMSVAKWIKIYESQVLNGAK